MAGGEPQRFRRQRAPRHRQRTGRCLVGHSSDRAAADPDSARGTRLAPTCSSSDAAAGPLCSPATCSTRRCRSSSRTGPAAMTRKHVRLRRPGGGSRRWLPIPLPWCCRCVYLAPRVADQPSRGGVRDHALIPARCRWQRAGERSPVNGDADVLSRDCV